MGVLDFLLKYKIDKYLSANNKAIEQLKIDINSLKRDVHLGKISYNQVHIAVKKRANEIVAEAFQFGEVFKPLLEKYNKDLENYRKTKIKLEFKILLFSNYIENLKCHLSVLNYLLTVFEYGLERHLNETNMKFESEVADFSKDIVCKGIAAILENKGYSKNDIEYLLVSDKELAAEIDKVFSLQAENKKVIKQKCIDFIKDPTSFTKRTAFENEVTSKLGTVIEKQKTFVEQLNILESNFVETKQNFDIKEQKKRKKEQKQAGRINRLERYLNLSEIAQQLEAKDNLIKAKQQSIKELENENKKILNYNYKQFTTFEKIKLLFAGVRKFLKGMKIREINKSATTEEANTSYYLIVPTLDSINNGPQVRSAEQPVAFIEDFFAGKLFQSSTKKSAAKNDEQASSLFNYTFTI